jgi:hypothetical protein
VATFREQRNDPQRIENTDIWRHVILTLKIKAGCFSETAGNFLTIRRHIRKGSILPGVDCYEFR